jgi:hypothetical protein
VTVTHDPTPESHTVTMYRVTRMSDQGVQRALEPSKEALAQFESEHHQRLADLEEKGRARKSRTPKSWKHIQVSGL